MTAEPPATWGQNVAYGGATLEESGLVAFRELKYILLKADSLLTPHNNALVLSYDFFFYSELFFLLTIISNEGIVKNT